MYVYISSSILNFDRPESDVLSPISLLELSNTTMWRSWMKELFFYFNSFNTLTKGVTCWLGMDRRLKAWRKQEEKNAKNREGAIKSLIETLTESFIKRCHMQKKVKNFHIDSLFFMYISRNARASRTLIHSPIRLCMVPFDLHDCNRNNNATFLLCNKEKQNGFG